MKYLRLAVLTIIGLICLLVCGCENKNRTERKTVESGYAAGYLKEIQLDDGTRCVVWKDQFRRGGISCDWHGSN